MYQNIDKTNNFYCYNHRTGTHTYLGNKEEFISYLSKFFRDTEYKDTARWTWEVLNEQNLTMKDMILCVDSYYLREKTFYDGEYRIIDIRDYYKEAISYYKNNLFIRRLVRFKKYGRRIKSHSGNRMRNKMPKTARILRMNDKVEKEFVRGTEKLLPRYWDDKGRRISSCWKDQKKYKKQWMHKIGSKNSDSIRYLQMEED